MNTPLETLAKGNPLSDFLATDNLGVDGAAEAWVDLRFSSRPIFVFGEYHIRLYLSSLLPALTDGPMVAGLTDGRSA